MNCCEEDALTLYAEDECLTCEHYDPEDAVCMAFECNGLECPKLPCEEDE